MTKRPTVEKCAKTVYGGSWGGSPCARRGVNLEFGEWWCKQHTPSLIKAKRAAESAAWQAKYESRRQEAAARHQETDERDRRAECFPALVAALKAAVAWLEERPAGIHPEIQPWYESARLALDKAKGE
jgi:hypothetical protein